jgi:hypothetical protein
VSKSKRGVIANIWDRIGAPQFEPSDFDDRFNRQLFAAPRPR